MKLTTLFFCMVILQSCVIDSELLKFNFQQSEIVLLDSDCDGVSDNLDLRNGGNDNIDLNGDNLPDIVYLVDYATLNPAWKCGAPYQQKAYCCKKTISGYVTICTYYSAFQAHINKGGYCGQCNEANCN